MCTSLFLMQLFKFNTNIFSMYMFNVILQFIIWFTWFKFTITTSGSLQADFYLFIYLFIYRVYLFIYLSIIYNFFNFFFIINLFIHFFIITFFQFDLFCTQWLTQKAQYE